MKKTGRSARELNTDLMGSLGLDFREFWNPRAKKEPRVDEMLCEEGLFVRPEDFFLQKEIVGFSVRRNLKMIAKITRQSLCSRVVKHSAHEEPQDRSVAPIFI